MRNYLTAYIHPLRLWDVFAYARQRVVVAAEFFVEHQHGLPELIAAVRELSYIDGKVDERFRNGGAL